MQLDDHSSISFVNCTIINEIDCFVFCFSQGDLNKLTEIMCDPTRPDYAYDSCVELAAPRTLADAVLRTGSVDGSPVEDNFYVSVGRVDYNLTEHDLLRDGVAPADPFRKDRRYITQQEVRIVLTPKNPLHCDFVNITLPNPSTLFGEQFRYLPIPKGTSKRFPDERSTANLFAVLSAAFKEWEGFPSAPFEETMALSYDERVALFQKQSADRDEAFDKHGDEVVKAYWTLRQKFPDPQLDLDIARSAKAHVFCNHLRNYLMRVWAHASVR